MATGPCIMNVPKKTGKLSDSLVFSEEEYSMHLENNRLKSFNDWPFDETCSCNPSTMAKAGFYHIPTDECPDGVRCFHCFKELDGWEPEDNPAAEHKKHSPSCSFLTLKKSFMQMTVSEFLTFECKRQENKLKKVYSLKIDELTRHAAEVRKKLSGLN